MGRVHRHGGGRGAAVRFDHIQVESAAVYAVNGAVGLSVLLCGPASFSVRPTGPDVRAAGSDAKRSRTRPTRIWRTGGVSRRVNVSAHPAADAAGSPAICATPSAAATAPPPRATSRRAWRT